MIIYATPVIGIVYLIQCFSDLTITNVEQSNKVNKAIYTSKQSNIYFKRTKLVLFVYLKTRSKHYPVKDFLTLVTKCTHIGHWATLQH